MFLYLYKIDLSVILSIAILGITSVVTIASVAPELFVQQLMWFAIGVLVLVAIVAIDVRPFLKNRAIVLIIYGIAILLLVLTLFVAPSIRGTRSWIPIGPMQFQTSELVKVGLILLLAHFFAKRHVGIAHLGNILIPSLYLLIPGALILAQPDMGSALILGGIFLGYLCVSGLRLRHIALGIIICSLAFIWAWSGYFKPYQKERIMGLFYPESDPLGINYSVIQSKIAIGSGGFWGKGFKQGTQVQLGFLPEAQTDFIFASLVEEWGLFGGFIAISAFVVLVLRIGAQGFASQDNFIKLVCLGTMLLFVLHFMLNMGSVLGLLPVIGVPLPFLSYGGSNLLINFILIGIIQSMTSRALF